MRRQGDGSIYVHVYIYICICESQMNASGNLAGWVAHAHVYVISLPSSTNLFMDRDVKNKNVLIDRASRSLRCVGELIKIKTHNEWGSVGPSIELMEHHQFIQHVHAHTPQREFDTKRATQLGGLGLRRGAGAGESAQHARGHAAL